MVTFDELVGAMLSGIARGRVLGDAASAEVAGQYARHDLLKSFPIPRMTIGSIDVEMAFAIAPQGGATAALSDVEVQKNATYRLRQLLLELGEDPHLRAYIGKDAKGGHAWRDGLDGAVTRLGAVVGSPIAGLDSLLERLSVTVSNYLYECASEEARAHLFATPKSGKDASSGALKPEIFIRDRIRAALAPLLFAPADAGSETAGPLNVLVSPTELERVHPASLQRAKFTITSSDRRWVTTEKDGAKGLVLDRA